MDNIQSINLLYDAILEVLGSNRKPSKRLVAPLRELNFDVKKSDVNKALYTMLKNKRVIKYDGTPPMWQNADIKEPEPDVRTGERMYVMIDVANSPCFEEASKYASEAVRIHAIAPLEYNGYKGSEVGYTYFNQLKTKSTGAVAISFCKHMTQICKLQEINSTGKPIDISFLVVSKDKTMATVAEIVASEYSEVLTNGWDDLRLHLE